MTRSSHVQALLGSDLYNKLRETPVLVVGAGGIGCELLKNLVLVGFANIEIIDLDTIDLSNLNRQFLFRKPDISKSKALVAAVSAKHFNPSSGIKIHARHGNVKEGQNDLEWIQSFGLVMNALDNMDARRHVNRLCQAAGVPLIESGTAGYAGQVTPIIKDKTECFDCTSKPVPKSFPVCTIRATPSEPIHCIAWAKSYLFNKLFGEDDEAGEEEELERAKAQGENANEVDNLKKEAAAFREVRRSLGEQDGPESVFRKVFKEDIERLLKMEDMWKVAGRVKPVALEMEMIKTGEFVVPPLRVAIPSGVQNGGPRTKGKANGENGTNGSATAKETSSGLKDQRELSVKDNLDLFIDSCRRLTTRIIAAPSIPLSFDKDDDDTLDFVVSTSNLRSIAYGIPTRTRFQIKEMAGNIIPAIATTNAIVAGLIVMQALNVLSKNLDKSNNVWLRADAMRPLRPEKPSDPNEKCAVCRDVYVKFGVDVRRCTLGEFVNKASKVGDEGDEEEINWIIMEGGRVLADPDFEDNHERTFEDLGLSRGKMITVEDEDGVYRPVHFCLVEL
ncbi:hypothetical protein TREMEDRAFT_45923 [Tremella mesenterica DSM 1558]|uniref:uncharacterized protein n=1 Tax=Tremella mesenterica (strain ATCC 24925 / CBS 8224 / DSM 1558 / NBRC 9311 / NRRL Y-6157 / RJB 2259-6 / UBC 559-6) TaxID=578456 RepID=UPI00032D6563|nr:uncharacterized protein TREMEDRAFT_45923 [Tremella mesenterica DSM 1558]EIW66085.1 hypothetical protein TREMEDRAFT_45923 [Tremella mesenterica DSM 1558]